MIKYFKELLAVLKSIDKNVKKIADCVCENDGEYAMNVDMYAKKSKSNTEEK